MDIVQLPQVSSDDTFIKGLCHPSTVPVLPYSEPGQEQLISEWAQKVEQNCYFLNQVWWHFHRCLQGSSFSYWKMEVAEIESISS